MWRTRSHAHRDFALCSHDRVQASNRQQNSERREPGHAQRIAPSLGGVQQPGQGHARRDAEQYPRLKIELEERVLPPNIRAQTNISTPKDTASAKPASTYTMRISRLWSGITNKIAHH